MSVLTFTPQNWNVPQVVTVSAVDDNVFEASPQTGTVTHSADSDDQNYDGIAVADVTATIEDNDPIVVTSTLDAIADDGVLTLREAIMAVNASPGTDTVQFAIGDDNPNHVYYKDDGLASFGSGIAIKLSTAGGNHIAGNFIGTDVTGTIAPSGLPYVSATFFSLPYGVLVEGDVQNNWIGTNGDGVADEHERNIISGNGRFGIVLGAGGGPGTVNTSDTLVAGNSIGPDVNGNALGNGYAGMYIIIGFCSNQIGRPTEVLGNTIAFNGSLVGHGPGL